MKQAKANLYPLVLSLTFSALVLMTLIYYSQWKAYQTLRSNYEEVTGLAKQTLIEKDALHIQFWEESRAHQSALARLAMWETKYPRQAETFRKQAESAH